MMNFNIFEYLRNAAKSSILLGVSDAVNTMGMPHDDAAKEQILPFLRNEIAGEPQVRRISNGTLPTGTKKLGRSLNDIAMKDAS
jgi:hypothetical protein